MFSFIAVMLLNIEASQFNNTELDYEAAERLGDGAFCITKLFHRKRRERGRQNDN